MIIFHREKLSIQISIIQLTKTNKQSYQNDQMLRHGAL